MDYHVLNGKIDLNMYKYPNMGIGVIVHIYDDNGNILLQQRGEKSRDENGLYEDVGGRYEESDNDYKVAIIREMQEEMGSDIKIELSDEVGIYHCYKNNINWVFIIFLGKYVSGKAKIMEPSKCMGYKFFTFDEVISSNTVSESCKFLTKEIRKMHNC